jgi:hypothetical protein
MLPIQAEQQRLSKFGTLRVIAAVMWVPLLVTKCWARADDIGNCEDAVTSGLAQGNSSVVTRLQSLLEETYDLADTGEGIR